MVTKPHAAAVRVASPPLRFQPFYWRIVGRSQRPFMAQLGIAGSLGAAFLVLHFASTGKQIFHDLSWMVGLLTASAMLGLFHATSTLLDLIAEADMRVSSSSRHLYMEQLLTWLSDGKFVLAGLVFGILNCIMGWVFGTPSYQTWFSKVTIFFGFFLVGVVAGMAAYGLVGIFAFVKGLVEAQPALDYREPDGCGGMSFVGQALVRFSVLNLVMGVMISVYIVFAPWSHPAYPDLARFLKWLWIALPFLVSVAHMLGPGSIVHALLQRYKKAMYAAVTAEVRSTREKLKNENTNSLRDELEYNLKLQSAVYDMNTWPFSMVSTAHFAIALCADAIPAYTEILKLLRDASHRF